jgi:hypothetical protein
MALINYFLKKHIVLKQIIDPMANIKDKWSKIPENNKIKVTSQWQNV